MRPCANAHIAASKGLPWQPFFLNLRCQSFYTQSHQI